MPIGQRRLEMLDRLQKRTSDIRALWQSPDQKSSPRLPKIRPPQGLVAVTKASFQQSPYWGHRWGFLRGAGALRRPSPCPLRGPAKRCGGVPRSMPKAGVSSW